MSIKVGLDHVVRTSFLTSNCLHVFSWIECIHCQTEASQQPSADHMTVVSHTHLHVLSNHSPHTHVCTHGHARAHTHTHTCTTSPATDYFTASLDYRKWRNVNAVTHTHRHTPSWVAFPSNTKLWLSREREREREGVFTDTSEGVVEDGESDRVRGRRTSRGRHAKVDEL